MILFDNTETSDGRFTNSLAEGIAGILRVAGLHRHEYEQKTLNPGSGVFTVSGQTVTASAAGSFHLCEIANNTILEVTIPSGYAVLFTNTAKTKGCGVRLSGDFLEFVDITQTTVTRYVRKGSNRWRICHLETTDFKNELLYKTIAVWSGDRFIGAHSIAGIDDFATRIYLEADQAGSFTDIVLDDLDIPVRAITVDASEQIQAAMNRLFQTESKKPVFLYSRYDGTVRFRTFHIREVVADLDNYAFGADSTRRARNWSALKSYVRAVSAYPEADFLDGDIADAVGPAYLLTQNPNITTVGGALIEAERVQNTTEEQHRQLALVGYPLLLLEPGDPCHILDGLWIVTQFDASFGPGGKLAGTTTFRKGIDVA